MNVNNMRPGCLLLSLLLAGCAVGPDYQPPQAQVPAVWHDLPSQAASRPQAGAPRADWWKNFNDPQLNSLIDRAILGNLSLQQAVLRIAGAREQLAQARGGLFPSVNGRASAQRQQLGAEGVLKANGAYDLLDSNAPELRSSLDSLTRPISLYQGSFDASWELDLWGKVRASGWGGKSAAAGVDRKPQRCAGFAGCGSGARLATAARRAVNNAHAANAD